MIAKLRALSVRCGHKRVAGCPKGVMRASGLADCHRRSRLRTTQGEPRVVPASDLGQRRLVAGAPNQRWTADITYIPTWSELLYLAVVLDVFSRRVVGWAMADHLRSELVVTALEMAQWNR